MNPGQVFAEADDINLTRADVRTHKELLKVNDVNKESIETTIAATT